MIDAQEIGRLVAEAVLNDPGPCFYPGRFKPPHKGHFEAAKSLASKSYIKQVNVVISSKVVEGITPEDSLAIWNMYLKAQPNPKILVQIATEDSPIITIINYLKANPEVETVYVAVGNDEPDDESYGESLQKSFGDRVKLIKVQERAGDIDAPRVRELLRSADMDGFIESVPEAAFNKGAGPKIFKMLAGKITDKDESEES